MYEKEKLLQQQGKKYRVHWNGYLILCCQCFLPLLLAGVLQYFCMDKSDILDSAGPVYFFFLPPALVGGILNLFIGRSVAVFEEKGFYALREVELSKWNEFENKEKMIYIPYDKIQSICYKPTVKRRPNHRSDYSAVEVTYTYTDAESGQVFIDICVLRCGSFTREARDFAKRIVRQSKRKISIEKDKISYFLFMGIIIAAYVFYFCVV